MASQTILNSALNSRSCQFAAFISGCLGVGFLAAGIMGHKFVLIISGAGGIACAALFSGLKIGQQVKIAKFKNQKVVTPYTPAEENGGVKSEQVRVVDVWQARIGDPEHRGNVSIHTKAGKKGDSSDFYTDTNASFTRNEDL